MSLARDNRCWNRAALHHLAYYSVREATDWGAQIPGKERRPRHHINHEASKAIVIEALKQGVSTIAMEEEALTHSSVGEAPGWM